MAEAWNGFKGRLWKEEVNVRDFIQNNYTPYDGDEKFLAGPTEGTNKLFAKLQELQKKKSTLQAEAELLRSLLQSQFHFTSRKEFASTVNKISNPVIRQFCFSDKTWEDMTKDWSAKKWVEKLK